MRIVTWSLLSFVSICSPALAGERQDRAKAAGIEWGKCVLSNAQTYAQQPEPAETLATAAMGACLDDANNFRHLLSESTREYGLPFASRAPTEEIDNAYAKIEVQLKSAAVTAVIQARAK